MLYKNYGKTDKKVSVIGFGGMRFPTGEKGYDYDYCVEMVRTASSCGINYFDTAPGYNSTHSESIFGKAFKKMPNDFYVSTKSMAKTADSLRKDLETSLRKMNLDKINFFHIWSVLSMDDYRERMKKGGAYEGALKAKEEGLIEHIAISTHCTGDEIDEIVSEDLFEGMLLGYNILNFPYRLKGIQAAYNKGWGVVTMNPLGGGLIPQNSSKLSFIINNDLSILESAIEFNCNHREISVVLTGMDSIEHIKQNADIAGKIKDTIVDESRYKELEMNISEKMNTLCTGCSYCEPCPYDITPSKYMLAYNKKLFGDKGNVLDFLKWHFGIPKEKAGDCTECGLCEEKCTQHLPIIERLHEISKY